MRWTAACRQHASQQGLPADCCDPLDAFGGGPEREAADFEGLLATAEALTATLPAQIVSVLSAEVDAAQASIFARRFAAVCRLLATLPQPTARLLSVGVAMRTAEVLAAPAPRALRVRAVVDFFYSQAALLHHRDPTAPRLRALVASARYTPAGDGLRHARLSGLTDQGPVHANVLRARSRRIATVDCRGAPSLAAVVARHGAAAGVSGGFFLYSEPDILPPSRRTDPVGLLVHGGTVLNPPVWSRSALLQRPGGAHRIERLGLTGCRVRWPDGSTTLIGAVNAPTADGCVAFTRAAAEVSPPRPGTTVAIVGDRVIARGTGPLPVPLAGVVLSLPGPLPSGERVRWSLPAPIAEGIAGGPRLLRRGTPEVALAVEDFTGSAPPITFSKDETFDQNLLPRMAAGLTADGELVFVAIDGRNFERAPGMTLRQTAALCQMLGCVEAMNLDGGSSKRMVVRGQLVDLPSTEVVSGGGGRASVRPVNTAVLIW